MPILQDKPDALCKCPVLKTEMLWPFPNFIGQGLLDSIRMTVDPAQNAFYSGPV